MKQYQLIQNDGVHMASYAARTFDGVAQNSHVRRDNWFYFNCLTGELPPWLGGKALDATYKHTHVICGVVCLAAHWVTDWISAWSLDEKSVPNGT